jgi:hypothetical protein
MGDPVGILQLRIGSEDLWRRMHGLQAIPLDDEVHRRCFPELYQAVATGQRTLREILDDRSIPAGDRVQVAVLYMTDNQRRLLAVDIARRWFGYLARDNEAPPSGMREAVAATLRRAHGAATPEEEQAAWQKVKEECYRPDLSDAHGLVWWMWIDLWPAAAYAEGVEDPEAAVVAEEEWILGQVRLYLEHFHG